MHDRTLHQMWRVTAFVDVLGWATLTGGVTTHLLRKLRLSEKLNEDDVALAAELTSNYQRALEIDTSIASIVQDLRSLAEPDDALEGNTDAVNYWRNHHVTFARFSDNIFLHSTSLSMVLLFVAELLKRGLQHGILFRAGLSSGLVVHKETASHGGRLDSRSRDITLLGDGITTAVLAERAGKGSGCRVLVHKRLTELLRDEERPSLRPFRAQRGLLCRESGPDVVSEFAWWSSLAEFWQGSDERAGCFTDADEAWRKRMLQALTSDPRFDWNRKTASGREKLLDTARLLELG